MSARKVGEVCVVVLAIGAVILFKASRDFGDRNRMLAFAAGGALMVVCLVVASLGQINRDINSDRDRDRDDQTPPES